MDRPQIPVDSSNVIPLQYSDRMETTDRSGIHSGSTNLTSCVSVPGWIPSAYRCFRLGDEKIMTDVRHIGHRIAVIFDEILQVTRSCGYAAVPDHRM